MSRPRRRLSLFRAAIAIIGLSYLVFAGLALNHTIQMLNKVSSELPVDLLETHRGLSSMVQTLSVLHNKLEAAWSTPSFTAENELIAATDAAVVMQSYLRHPSAGRAATDLGPLGAEIAIIVARIDDLTRKENFDPLEAQLLDTRLDHSLNILESRYIGTSEASLAELAEQIDRIRELKGDVRKLILALIAVSVLAVGLAFGAWAANRRLATAQSALQAARDEALAANAVKTRFLSNMSTALQTPLNAILGFSELLSLAADKPDGARIRAMGEQISRSGFRLKEQIHNLLELAAQDIGPDKVAPARCNTSDVAAQALGLVAADADERAIRIENTLHGAVGPCMTADPDRLRQILHNFLSNAVKFHDDGGTVWIEAETRGDVVRLLVRDDGPGLPKENRAQLFNAFERLGREGADTAFGVGLGLALAKQRAEAMAGEVGFMDAPGGGAIFYVDLPNADA